MLAGAASGPFWGGPVMRQILIVIGAGLVSVGGLSLICALVWLWMTAVHGTPTYVMEARIRVLLYLLPALFLAVAFLGASLMAHALAARRGSERKPTDLQAHTHAR
jgi:hypothetical protein